MIDDYPRPGISDICTTEKSTTTEHRHTTPTTRGISLPERKGTAKQAMTRAVLEHFHTHRGVFDASKPSVEDKKALSTFEKRYPIINMLIIFGYDKKRYFY